MKKTLSAQVKTLLHQGVSLPGAPRRSRGALRAGLLVFAVAGLGLAGCTSSIPAGHVPGGGSGVHEVPSGKDGVNSGQAPHESGDASDTDNSSDAGGDQGGQAETGKGGKDQAGSSQPVKYQVSNLADATSRKEVAAALKAALPAPDVDAFMAAVKDYNDTIKNTTLTSGFAPAAPQYDLDKIEKLWQSAKGNYIGADCRISAFQLVRTGLKTPPTGNADAGLLFQDLDAIKAGRLFNATDTQRFQQLFSRVKTTKTTEVKAHAAKMAAHFQGFRFPGKARLVTVVINDNLDGNNLFVGHVGVLVPAAGAGVHGAGGEAGGGKASVSGGGTRGVSGGSGGKWLFVEKISFQEPYQALKFDSPRDCYRYLAEKYRDYADEGAAKPFVMANGKLATP